MLPIAMITGVIAYFIYSSCHIFDFSRPYAPKVVAIVQPLLIFSMLFLSFCKIDVRNLRPRLTHLWLLLIQCGLFALLSLLVHFLPDMEGRTVVEAALLCLICPTATAATVVTQKLHGDATDITMYTILINLAVAVIVPLFVPLVHPQVGQTFFASFMLIIGKVFPLLICPLLAAIVVREYMPHLHSVLIGFHDLAFKLWAIALSIAIAVTMRTIVHSTYTLFDFYGIAIVSFLTCAFQFALGRFIGRRYGTPISTCQSLGQKNTVFAIWMGYTFLNPITSIAGGFYSIWHNLYNTYQLRQQEKRELM